MSRQELKKQLVELYNKGMSVDEICATYNVPKSTFYRWIRKTKDVKVQISEEDISLIAAHIAKLEEEASTYKKVLQLLQQAAG